MNWFFSDYFVVGFVVITLLLAFDFWTVKNVTGRLLVRALTSSCFADSLGGIALVE